MRVFVLPLLFCDWCLDLMLGCVVVGYVKLACFCDLCVDVDDCCLDLVLDYVVVGYVQ